MPNHIKNKIELSGSPSDIEAMVKRFSTSFERSPRKTEAGELLIFKNKTTDQFGWYNEKENTFEYGGNKRGLKVEGIPEGYEQDYDEAWTRFPCFDKIKPMPPTLLITSGSLGEMAHELLFGYNKRKFFRLAVTEQQQCFSKLSIEQQKEAVALGIQYQENLEKYGHTTWYDWSIEHWGTKWNAYSCQKISDAVYTFETAWSGVPSMIEVMSKEFPGVSILYKYSDEDTGSNCGIGEYKGGCMYLREITNRSKEAYDLAFELRPDRKENYKLVGGKYEYVDEEQ